MERKAESIEISKDASSSLLLNTHLGRVELKETLNRGDRSRCVTQEFSRVVVGV